MRYCVWDLWRLGSGLVWLPWNGVGICKEGKGGKGGEGGEGKRGKEGQGLMRKRGQWGRGKRGHRRTIGA